MANQQQHQNPQPAGTDPERGQQSTASPGQTTPGRGNDGPGDQRQRQTPGDQTQEQQPLDPGRQNPREREDQVPRDPSDIPE
jgi:hypothetical protein